MLSGDSRHGRTQSERISAPHASLTAGDGEFASATCEHMPTTPATTNPMKTRFIELYPQPSNRHLKSLCINMCSISLLFRDGAMAYARGSFSTAITLMHLVGLGCLSTLVALQTDWRSSQPDQVNAQRYRTRRVWVCRQTRTGRDVPRAARDRGRFHPDHRL